MSMLSHMPLQAGWLAKLPAFASEDAALVRASVKLLLAAWHAQPAGTLPADEGSIAAATGLTIEQARAARAILVAGWTLGKPKSAAPTMTFEPLATMARGLNDHYAHALERMQQAALVAIAAPDLFNTELLPVQGQPLAEQVGERVAKEALSRTNVARKLPENTPLTDFARQTMAQKGFSAAMHDEIWQRFCDYMISKGERSDSWSRSFRYWLGNQLLYGKLVPDIPGTGASSIVPAPRPVTRFVPRPPSRGEQVEAVSRTSLDRAAAAFSRRLDSKGKVA